MKTFDDHDIEHVLVERWRYLKASKDALKDHEENMGDKGCGLLLQGARNKSKNKDKLNEPHGLDRTDFHLDTVTLSPIMFAIYTEIDNQMSIIRKDLADRGIQTPP